MDYVDINSLNPGFTFHGIFFKYSSYRLVIKLIASMVDIVQYIIDCFFTTIYNPLHVCVVIFVIIPS